MFRSCRNRFRCFSQMKITNPELFWNALKIIMVGTGNVLSPHKYFQFERTLKNVTVNSESAFWDIFWVLRYFGMMWMDESPLGGPSRSLAGHMWGFSLELHMSFGFSLLPLESVSFLGIFGILNTHPTPWFSYIRRRVGCPLLHPFLTYKCHA